MRSNADRRVVAVPTAAIVVGGGINRKAEP